MIILCSESKIVGDYSGCRGRRDDELSKLLDLKVTVTAESLSEERNLKTKKKRYKPKFCHPRQNSAFSRWPSTLLLSKRIFTLSLKNSSKRTENLTFYLS